MGFSHIAVIGPGLIGGSVAMAARRFASGTRVTMWARRAEALAEIVELGIVESPTDSLEDAVSEADLIVLATPVGVMAGLVARMLEGGLRPGTVLTDVGSVKGGIVAEMDGLLAGHPEISFVGSHPMAGSEMTGIVHAREDLFEGAACPLTPGLSSRGGATERVGAFWSALGARVTIMDPAAHDRAVASISHLPHLVASALAAAALGPDPSVAALAANGFRDTTRVASGSPSMWTEIAMENREALREPLIRMATNLRELLAFLDKMEHERLHRFLGEAKRLRDAACPRPKAPQPPAE